MPEDLVRPCFQVLPQEPTRCTTPIPPCHPTPVGDEPTQPSEESGGEAGPRPKPARASRGPHQVLGAVGAAQEPGARRPALRSGGTPGAAFQVGTQHKGPFVLSFPWPALHCSPEKCTMGHCAEQKRAPCPASSSAALGSLLGSAQGGRGHQRGLLGAHVLMSPPGSSFLS